MLRIWECWSSHRAHLFTFKFPLLCGLELEQCLCLFVAKREITWDVIKKKDTALFWRRSPQQLHNNRSIQSSYPLRCAVKHMIFTEKTYSSNPPMYVSSSIYNCIVCEHSHEHWKLFYFLILWRRGDDLSLDPEINAEKQQLLNNLPPRSNQVIVQSF